MIVSIWAVDNLRIKKNTHYLRMLRKIANNGQNYNRKFQDKLIGIMYSPEGELIEELLGKIFLERDENGKVFARFIFKPGEDLDWEFAREELILLAGLAYGRHKKALQFLGKIFNFNDLIGAIQNEENNVMVRAGLLRVLIVAYIDCPGHEKFMSIKSFRFDEMKKNFPPKVVTDFPDSDIISMWNALSTVLSPKTLDGNEVLIYDALCCGLAFVNFNLIWKISASPLKDYIFILFSLMTKIYDKYKALNASSPMNLQNMEIDETEENYNLAIRISLSEMSSLINQISQETNLGSKPQIKILRKLEIILSDNFSLIQVIRNDTLLLNAIQYFNEKRTVSSNQNVVLSELIREQETILPGKAFVKRYPLLIEDLSSYYEEYKNSEGDKSIESVRPDSGKTSRAKNAQGPENFLDHLILMYNRMDHQNMESQLHIHTLIIGQLKQCSVFMRGIEYLVLLKSNKEEILYFETVRCVQNKLIPLLDLVNQNTLCRYFEDETPIHKLLSSLSQIYSYFDCKDDGSNNVNELVQIAFRNSKGHMELIKFLRKNRKLFVASKRGETTGKLQAETLNNVFDLIFQILIAFCKKQKKNKNDLWPYLKLLIFDNIQVTKRSYEMELILEIFIDNSKVALTYTFSDFIRLLKAKASPLLRDFDLIASKTAKTFAKIFLEILNYEKLFPETKWFIKLYKSIYGCLEILPATDIDDVEIFVGFLEYLDKVIGGKVLEIGGDHLQCVFKPSSLFLILSQLNLDISTFIHVIHQRSFYQRLVSPLLTIYGNIYFPETINDRVNFQAEIDVMFEVLKNQNFLEIYNFYSRENAVPVWHEFKHGLLSKLLSYDKCIGITQEEIECCDDLKNSLQSRIATQVENDYEDANESIEKEFTKPFFSNISLQHMNTLNYVDSNIQQIWNSFKKEFISPKTRQFVLMERQDAANLFRTSIEKYINKEIRERDIGYMEFLKKNIDMYMNTAILEKNAVQTFDLHVFLMIMILLLKNYEKEVLDQKISSSMHSRITSKLISMGAMKMCYNMIVHLKDYQLDITESLLLSLMKHLMYAEGEEGQEELISIFQNNKATENIMNRISKVMDFTIQSITEYRLYRSFPDTSFVSKYPYKLKLDLIKNIYDFLTIAADNNYTAFQEYLRHQENTRQSYNLVKMSVYFLDRALPSLNGMNMLHLAQFPLRAILEFIQGPNYANMQVIIENGIFKILRSIYSDLDIQELDPNEQDEATITTIRNNNFAKMKLKYFSTEIVEDILENSKQLKEIYAKFRTLITSESIMQNLYDYTYLFYVEQNCKYESKLLFNFLRHDLSGGSLVVEVGFELFFLLNILKDISDTFEQDYEDIQYIIRKPRKGLKGFCNSLSYLISKACGLFCSFQFKSTIIRQLFANRDQEDFKLMKVKEIIEKVIYPYTGNIEVIIDGKATVLYFTRFPYIDYLDEVEIDEFEEKVDFASNKTRNEGLLRAAPSILNSIRTEYEVSKMVEGVFILNLIYLGVDFYKGICMLLSFGINILLLLSDTIDENVDNIETMSYSGYNISILSVGIILLVFSSLIFAGIALRKFPYHWAKAINPNWELLNQKYSNELNYMEKIGGFLFFVFQDYYLLYYLSVCISCILAIGYNPFFFAYSLSIIVIRLKIITNLLRAIVEPAKQIFLTLIIYFIVVYIFTLIASVSYKSDFPNENCSELLKCYLVSLDQTFKSDGGLAGYINLTYANGPTVKLSRIIFDFFYAFIIGELLMQMISGIVIDKFQSMREESEEQVSQYSKECFICGKDRGMLESETRQGFKHHISKKHNLWDYIYFIGYLKDKPEYELDAAESYIRKKIEANDVTWFQYYPHSHLWCRTRAREY